MDTLDGKVCVITGGAGGIGLALAHRFRDDGASIVLGDVDAEALDAARAELGDDVLTVPADVTSQESMHELRAAAVDRFGTVDVACLNAGVAPMGLLLDTALETWRWVIEVNVLGVVHGLRAFGPGLVEQGGGHLVFTASAAGLSTTPGLGAYTATKHAVVGIAATARAELEAAGVGVSVVCPGAVRTRIFESERNRPAEFGTDDDAMPAPLVDAYRQSVAASPDPMLVADAVHDAVLHDRFMVLPSPEVDPIVEERIEQMRAGLDRR